MIWRLLLALNPGTKVATESSFLANLIFPLNFGSEDTGVLREEGLCSNAPQHNASASGVLQLVLALPGVLHCCCSQYCVDILANENLEWGHPVEGSAGVQDSGENLGWMHTKVDSTPAVHPTRQKCGV